MQMGMIGFEKVSPNDMCVWLKVFDSPQADLIHD